MSATISLVVYDGIRNDYPKGITGSELAKSISRSLQRKALAYSFNGIIRDLEEPIIKTGKIKILTAQDSQSVDLIRHSCAHVLAEAVQKLFPKVKIAIGPITEKGFYYDFFFEKSPNFEDLIVIENKMREIIFVNQSFKKEIWTREKAKKVFSEKNEIFKLEIINKIPYNEEIRIYYQGDWFDLCRGPHLASTGQIGNHFKLTKISGTYWKGNSNGPVLCRIYGIAFLCENDLKNHLNYLQEISKRDHRRLGKEMNLFHFQEESAGVVFWHPKGWKILQNLLSYMRRRLEKNNYLEVNTPQVLDKSLWEISGHWDWYKNNMFKVIPNDNSSNNERVYALKPMNCPAHVQLFKQGVKSYRELPIRISEFGIVHRYELSGSLHGLMRTRTFMQDDAHIFCMNEQLAEECFLINHLILSTYKDFGFTKIIIKLSTRPKKRIGSDDLWDQAEKVMMYVLKKIENFSENVTISILDGEGAFYGPKFEYTLQDAIGREWQCGTIQIDFNLPERFSAFYIDKNSNKQHPVMIHRAIFGSIERFLGILLENSSGHIPLWLYPNQILIASITSDVNDYVKESEKKFQNSGLTVQVDIRNEKISYKIREHFSKKIPIILVCGRKESERNTFNIRRLGSNKTVEIHIDQLISDLKREVTPPDLLYDK